MGLFTKNINKNEDTAFRRVEFIRVEDNKTVLELADKLMSGKILCLNFEECVVSEANEMLSFLSGICYALDGNVIAITNKVYLIAQKSDFKDGSLKRFIDQYKE